MGEFRLNRVTYILIQMPAFQGNKEEEEAINSMKSIFDCRCANSLPRNVSSSSSSPDHQTESSLMLRSFIGTNQGNLMKCRQKL